MFFDCVRQQNGKSTKKEKKQSKFLRLPTHTYTHTARNIKRMSKSYEIKAQNISSFQICMFYLMG